MTPPRPVPTIALTSLHRRTIFAAGIALVVSGAGWLACHYLMGGDPDFPDMPHPLEPFWLKVHGAIAMASLMVVGSVVPWHAWRAWKLRRNRGTGGFVASVLVVLILSAWALYYIGSEALRPGISLVHWIVGIASVPLLWLHVVRGRRSRSAPAR
jgi:hypothetical protein